jgi:lipoprotein-anchoring transpeptidase ErfK/SrfK
LSINRRISAMTVGVALLAPAVFAPHAAAARQPRVGVVAQAAGGAVSVYRFPGAKRPFLTLANPTASGNRLAFLVVQRINGWERVRLPVRPNGSTGWVRDRSVTLSLDPYRLVVSLGRHTLKLWNGSTLMRTEPAAVGRSVLPTPTGSYYLAELLAQADPNGPYGPFAFGTSAFSTVLYSFGGGPGQIGLHGTNEPGSLGSSISHGCIRIANPAIRFLARLLPLGTPIEITR